jgi:long-chain acyl-CoA synthetase
MPRWAAGLPARAARSLLQALVAFPLLRLFARLRVEGRGRLEPIAAPVLFAANHGSHLDVPVLLASMPRRLRRRVAVAMQPEYFEPYLRRRAGILTRLHMGWHYKLVSLLLHTFPFPRSAAFRVALEYAGSLVDEGWSILVFPEGELSRDGAIHAFRPGVGVLARRLALRVVPARIEGAFGILPRGGRFPRRLRGPVTVAWGEPMRIGKDEEPAAFAARVEAAVRAL